MIFCLKHFFLIYIFIPQDGRIVLSPWKRGAGAPGGRVENPHGDSAAVVAGLGGCHLIKPCLLYVRPSQIPPLGRAVEPPPPGGPTGASASLGGCVPAAREMLVLPGEERKGMVTLGVPRRWCPGRGSGGCSGRAAVGDRRQLRLGGCSVACRSLKP